MDRLEINTKIEQLNLEWCEYDFGDTLYAKIPITCLLDRVYIEDSCETSKYKIEFQPDGNAYIFKEIEQRPLFKKLFAIILQINTALSKQENKTKKVKERSIDY